MGGGPDSWIGVDTHVGDGSEGTVAYLTWQGKGMDTGRRMERTEEFPKQRRQSGGRERSNKGEGFLVRFTICLRSEREYKIFFLCVLR